MAKVSITGITDIRVLVIPGERAFDSPLVDPRVTKMYRRKGYADAPKTMFEATERGFSGFNGLMSSFVSIRQYPDGIIAVDIMATRFLLGQAVRDIAKEISDEAAIQASVDMANVSLLVPTVFRGKPVLVGQVKGKALGSGQVHAAMTAGNVKGRYLDQEDPLVVTLRDETSEEAGINLASLKSTAFILMVDERETGQVNFVSVAKQVEIETVLGAYSYSIGVKGFDDLEVKGLAIIPIRKATSIRKSIQVFEPNGKGGGEWKEEKRGLRPYTEAIIDWLKHKKNQDYLIARAGI